MGSSKIEPSSFYGLWVFEEVAIISCK